MASPTAFGVGCAHGHPEARSRAGAARPAPGARASRRRSWRCWPLAIGAAAGVSTRRPCRAGPAAPPRRRRSLGPPLRAADQRRAREHVSVSIPNYRDWRDGSRTFAAMVLWRPWSFNLSGDDRSPERLPRDDRDPEPVRRAAAGAGGRPPAAGQRRSARRPARPHQPRALAAPLRRRSRHRRPRHPAEPRAARRRRRRPARLHVPARRPGRRVGAGFDAPHRRRHLSRRARPAGLRRCSVRASTWAEARAELDRHRGSARRHLSRGSRLRRHDHADARGRWPATSAARW